MRSEALLDTYQDQLAKALSADESATAARNAGRGRDSEKLCNQAADYYAQAASTLLEVLENGDVEDRAELERSVDQLIQASKTVRKRGQQAMEQRSGSAAVACDDEDDVRFTPANVPDVTFDDIAGLDEAKAMIMDEIIHPVLYPDLYTRFHVDFNGGLLLFGPPGTGKTMLARAVANKANMAFFPVKCSDIVGKYFGEAEKHVRALFESARKAHDAVVFMDEAEALACRRGGNSTVMNRLVPELLAQMDGFERFDGRIIVIFATNRPYDIDPAFLRPGRLPHHCYIPLPSQQVRQAYLEKLLNMRPCEAGIDIEALATSTDRFSCADLANLVKRASLLPVKRSIHRQENGEPEQEDRVCQMDLNIARSAMYPSVEPNEIHRLEVWMRKLGMTPPDAAQR